MLTPAMQWVAELGVLLFFMAAAFFFALSETALLTLGKWRLRQVTAHNPGRGAFLHKLLATPQDLLATMTLGNTAAHAALIATVLVICWGHFEQYKLMWSVVCATVLLLFCEVVPKTLAMRRPEAWAPRLAYPMLALVQVTRPFRAVAQVVNNQLLRLVPKSVQPVEPLSDEEYSELLELGQQSGTLGATEKEIILQIMALDRRPVADIMKPRSQMACIPHDLSLGEMLAAARDYQHRRLPMYNESPDSIVGILNTPMLLANPEVDMVEVIDFPSFVPEEMNLLELLKSFQRGKHGMAVVLDEFGGTVGLVTLEDILTEVIGGLRREGVGERFVLEQTGEGSWRLSGNVWLEDFRRKYPDLQRAPGVDTIGGLVASRLDTIPPIGTEIEFSGLTLKVSRASERRVLEVVAEQKGRRR